MASDNNQAQNPADPPTPPSRPFTTSGSLATYLNLKEDDLKSFLYSRDLIIYWKELENWRDWQMPKNPRRYITPTTNKAQLLSDFENELDQDLDTFTQRKPEDTWNDHQRVLRLHLLLYKLTTKPGGIFFGKYLQITDAVVLRRKIFHHIWEIYSNRQFAASKKHGSSPPIGRSQSIDSAGLNYLVRNIDSIRDPEDAEDLLPRKLQKKNEEHRETDADADQINRNRHGLEITTKIGEIVFILMIAQAKAEDLENNAQSSHSRYGPEVLDRLDPLQRTRFSSLSDLDLLKIEADHTVFNLNDDLWKVVALFSLSAAGDIPNPNLLSTDYEPGLNGRLEFKLSELIDLSLYEKLFSRTTDDRDERDEVADHHKTIFGDSLFGHNDITTANYFMQPRKVNGLYVLDNISPQPLFPWQLTGIYYLTRAAICRLRRGMTSPRGLFLADAPGLGKTIQVVNAICKIFEILEENWDTLSKEQKLLWNKPTMMFCPALQIGQLLEDLLPYAKRQHFKLYRYYGQQDQYEHYGEFVRSPLSKTHTMFNTNGMRDQKFRAVIVTTRSTLVNRNGPTAEQKWLQEYSGLSKIQAKQHVESQMGIPHAQFPYSLRDQLSMLCIDEIQEIENATTKSNEFSVGINSTFFIGTTETPLQSGLGGAMGYFRLLEEPSIAIPDPAESQNPFLLEEGEPGFNYCFTQQAWDLYVKNSPADQQATYIRDALAQVMIARSIHTPVKPQSTEIIGSLLPKALSKSFHIQHTPRNQGLFELVSRGLVKNLNRSSTHQRREVDIASPALRRLHLASNMPHLEYCKDRYTADKMTAFIHVSSKDFFMDLFSCLNQYEILEYELPEDNSPLAISNQIRRDFPKLKLLSADIAQFLLIEKRNTIVLCSVPCEQLIVLHYLRLWGIRPLLFHSKLIDQARGQILNSMAKKGDKAQVLIATVELLGKSSNLQDLASVMIFLNAPKSEGARTQAMNGPVRFNSPNKVVDVREYHMANTF